MGTITKTTNLFPAELTADIFNKVAGHSSLAKLSSQKAIPFCGTDQFVFTMDGEVSIVGEGENKPAGTADLKSVSIVPVKFLYQHRLTNEFVYMSEDKQIPYLQAFTEGFAKKIARGLDIAVMHGVNPATGEAVASLATKNLDTVGSITTTSGAEDGDLESAITAIQALDGTVTGIALAPVFASSLGKIKANGVKLYPEFAFGGNPDSFAGLKSDVNNTVSFKDSKDLAFVGDFASAFKWGYAENIPMEIIEYGDPDGQGDLKRTNQIVLRAEAYIGWGILDTNSFKRIVSPASKETG